MLPLYQSLQEQEETDNYKESDATANKEVDATEDRKQGSRGYGKQEFSTRIRRKKTPNRNYDQIGRNKLLDSIQ